jgi:colicin import membrane protein
VSACIPRSRSSSTVRHLLSACLFAFAALAVAAGPVATDEQEADWERRLERASALQSEGETKKAEAEKLFEERKAACFRKFLVNRCQEAAYDDYIATAKEGRRQSNEGKAIERQVKKEQLNARDMQRIADTPQHQAELKEREADTTAARSAAAAEEAATRAKKAQQAEEGAQRKAGEAERQQRKQAEHEARVAEKKAEAAARPPRAPAAPLKP